MDKRSEETFTVPGGELQRIFATAQHHRSRAQGRAGTAPESLGDVIRPGDIPRLARRAGFLRVAAVPSEHPCCRFCRLTP